MCWLLPLLLLLLKFLIESFLDSERRGYRRSYFFPFLYLGIDCRWFPEVYEAFAWRLFDGRRTTACSSSGARPPTASRRAPAFGSGKHNPLCRTIRSCSSLVLFSFIYNNVYAFVILCFFFVCFMLYNIVLRISRLRYSFDFILKKVLEMFGGDFFLP